MQLGSTAPVAVIGGGTMGAGIAEAFLACRRPVALVEVNMDAAARAHGKIRASLATAHEKGKLPESAESYLDRLTLHGYVCEIPGGTDLVIEATPEDAELKARILTSVEDVVSESSILASNTSSLSVSALGELVRQPQRLVGMHFFNPVRSSKLIEIVQGTHTSQSTVDAALQVAEQLGRHAIVVRDSPGFASSRLGIALGLEAIRMLEEGVASAADIDTAMMLGYRHPIGPLKLTDLVGLDVRLAVAEHLMWTLGARFTVPGLLREMVARGDLGAKTGHGFYEWPSDV